MSTLNLSWATKKPLPALAADLEDLVIEGRHVVDLTALTGLTQLRSLTLAIGAADLAPLATLPALRRLELRSGAALDLTPVGATAIEELHLTLSKATHLRGLEPLRSLRRLTVRGAEHLHDYGAIAGLNGLEALEADRAGSPASLAPFAGLRSLRRLTIDCGRVKDFRPLSGLVSLERLVLVHGRGVSAGPGLRGLPNLEHVELRWGEFGDVSWLATLPRLRSVHVTDVMDLSALDGRGVVVTGNTPRAPHVEPDLAAIVAAAGPPNATGAVASVVHRFEPGSSWAGILSEALSDDLALRTLALQRAEHLVAKSPDGYAKAWHVSPSEAVALVRALASLPLPEPDPRRDPIHTLLFGLVLAPHPELAPVLAEVYPHLRPDLRAAALAVLGAIGTREAAGAFRECLATAGWPPRVYHRVWHELDALLPHALALLPELVVLDCPDDLRGRDRVVAAIGPDASLHPVRPRLAGQGAAIADRITAILRATAGRSLTAVTEARLRLLIRLAGYCTEPALTTPLETASELPDPTTRAHAVVARLRRGDPVPAAVIGRLVADPLGGGVVRAGLAQIRAGE